MIWKEIEFSELNLKTRSLYEEKNLFYRYSN